MALYNKQKESLMLKKFTNLLLVLLLSAPDNLSAANLQKNEVFVVDMIYIFQHALSVESVGKQINDINEEVSEELSKQELAFKEREDNLIKQKNNLSQKQFDDALVKFNKDLAVLHRKASEQKRKLEYSRSEAMQKIGDVIQSIIQDLSKEYGFKMAIPKSQVLYSTSDLDITEELLQHLNEKLKFVEVRR